MQHQRQEDVLAAERRTPRDCDRLGARAFRLRKHLAAEPHQPFFFQSELDVRDRVAHLGVPAKDVATVERPPPGAPRVRLAHDAADELGQGVPRPGVVQHRQHVGEGAIPSLHQRRPGDDPPYRRVFREQVPAGEFVALCGLHRDGGGGDAQGRHEIFPHVFRVDVLAVALALPSAFHPRHRDGADVPAPVRAQRPGLGLEPVQLLMGSRQRVGPGGVGVRRDPHRQLDHFLGLERRSGHVDQQVADSGVGRRRELQHHARVEAAHCAGELLPRLALLAIRLVRLVEDHRRAQHLDDVEQAVLDRAAGTGTLEVREGVRQPRIAEHVVARREEGGVAPGIAEHAEKLAAPAPVGGGEHEQHDAQVMGGVGLRERIVLLQQLHPSAARALQHLAAGVLAAAQRRPRLFVDGAGGDDPQGQAGPPSQPLKRGGCEQGLAAAGRDLEADVGDRPSRLVGARRVGPGGRGNGAGAGQALPRRFREVAQLTGDRNAALCERRGRLPRRSCGLVQRAAPARESVQSTSLVSLQLHGRAHPAR